MPQAAITAITGYLVSAGVSAVVAEFVATVFVYASASYLLNRASKALAPKHRANAGLGSGTEVNYYDSGAPVRIAYGRVKTGGMETIPPITHDIGGNNRQFLSKVLTIAGHEIDSYNYTHFDTTTITNNQIGTFAFTNSDGMVLSGPFSGHAFIRHYRGTSTDSADRMLIEVSSTSFGNFRGRGIAKVAMTFKYHENVYRAVPTVTFTFQGKRCYDPRLDSTPGANPTNSSFIQWTQNPALCLVDYLMSDLGGSYDAEDIDWDTVVTAANYCDDDVAVPGGTQKRYTCNGVLLATDEFSDNVKALVDSMLGRIIFRDGKWRIYAGSWQTPSFTIQKEDWISGLSIRLEQGKRKRFNQMRVWYVDPQREWQRVECVPRSNSTYKDADGGELIDAETEQLFCTSEAEAQRKAEFLLRQSRNQITVSGRLPPRFQNIALWDTGTIVFDHLGWSSKTFRCVGIDMNPDGSMDCVFTEEQSTDWADLDASEYFSPSTATLPEVNATAPTEPPSFSIKPNVNGTLLFEWTRPIVRPYGTWYQIIRSTNSANASVGTVVWEGDAHKVELVSPTSPHWYWVRAVANSTVSAYRPNTFGLVALPIWNRTPDGEDPAFPDGEFTMTAAGSHFWEGASAVWSFDANSGFTQGRGSLVLTSTDGYLSGNQQIIYPKTNASVFAGFQRDGRFELQVIRENSGTANFMLGITARKYSNKSSFVELMILPPTPIFVSSLNVGVWTTYSFNVTVPTSPWDRIIAHMSWYSAFGSDGGRTRIGKFQLYMKDN